MGKKNSKLLRKSVAFKLLLAFLFLLIYQAIKDLSFEPIDHFVRDSLQYFNSPNEIDESFVTLNININSNGITVPHTFEGMARVIDRLQKANPKNIIVMMEPLDFITEKNEKIKLFELFSKHKNLYLNKYEARNPMASFGNDELFKKFERFIHFYKCSDSPKERENRRALLKLSSFGETKIFQDLRQLGYNPKSIDNFNYSFEYWNSTQVFIKNYPLGSYGNYQTKELLNGSINENVFKNKTVIIGTNDEFSHLVSKSPFSLFGMKKENDYQKNWLPLQDVLANNLSLLTTGNYIKLLSNIDDIFIILLLVYFIVISNISFEKKLYFVIALLPILIAFEIFMYLVGSYYINLSRSLVIIVLGQYFIVPLVLLWKFRKQEEEKYSELNKVRISALVSISEQVAHDLRSPLSTVNLLLQKASFQKDEYRELIKSALSKIDLTISEILKSADIKSRLNLKPVNLSDVIDSFVLEMKTKFPDVVFESRFEKKHLIIATDDIRIIRVLTNIVQNSVEAMLESRTVCAKVSIEVKEVASHLLIRVTDNGPGIRAEILQVLGTKQFSSKSKIRGYGIGLLSSKKLLEEMGGTLSIKSDFGFGTEISVTLPKE